MDKEVNNSNNNEITNPNKDILNKNANNTKIQINKKVLIINIVLVIFFLMTTILVIMGSIIVPTDDSVFTKFFKFFGDVFGKSVDDIDVQRPKTNIDNSTINEINKLKNNSVQYSPNNQTNNINKRTNYTTQKTNTTNSTKLTNTTKVIPQKKCNATKTCNNYTGVCGTNLSDGCNNILKCYNCEKCLSKEIFCNNKIDEDCDGFMDCSDSDCKKDAACKLAYPENLEELNQRKTRVQKRFNIWNYSYLEDPYSYVWQPELLIYKEQKTGTEIVKLTGSINFSNQYNDYRDLEVWSPNGEFIYFISFRPTYSFNNNNQIKKSFEPFLMKVNSDGNKMISTSERPGLFRDAYSRYFDSPDKTKSAWQSDLLNFVNKTDIFYSVNYYPYPPTDITISNDNGIKISWVTPIYKIYSKEIKKYHIWRSNKIDKNWVIIGETLAEYVYNGAEIKPNLDLLYYIDQNLPNGDYYYAITSEEYSGLESNEFSEIIKVKIKNNKIESTEKAQDKGFKNFWTTKPDAPTNFYYTNLSIKKAYVLNWTEPVNNMIRYYNIYYSTKTNVTIELKYRIASVPYGNSRYIDFFADLNKTAYYGITSDDRYGNEGSIVYKKDPTIATIIKTEEKKKNFFEDLISSIIKFFS